MSNAESEYFGSLFRSPIDTGISTLEMLTLIDIGIIQDIDVNGRASILTTKSVNGAPFILHDVEVLGIGNRFGAFTAAGAGNTCLLFIPKSNIPDVRDMGIDIASPPFSSSGAKALPISNGRELLVNAYFNSEGTFSISTDRYQLSFTETSLSYNAQGLCISIDKDNKIYAYRRSEKSGIYELTLDDSGYEASFTNTDGDSKYTFSLQDSGELEITHTRPESSGEDKKLNSISIAKDGTLSITSSDKLTLTISPEGAISIDTEGDVGIKTKGSMSLTSTKDFSLTSQGGVSISAHGKLEMKSTDGVVDLSSSGTLTIKSTDDSVDIDSQGVGSAVNINGENLTIDA